MYGKEKKNLSAAAAAAAVNCRSKVLALTENVIN
jgi:hypothetical protein